MARRVRIEPMAEGDWPEVRRIYAEGIATGDATFESDVPGLVALGSLAPAEMPARRARPSVEGGRRLGRFDARLLTPDLCRRRLGERLCRGGVARSRRRPGAARGAHPGLRGGGFWTLQAGILVENEASLALHERVGFRRVGVQVRIGRDRSGRWRDRVLLERRSTVAGI